MHLGLLDRWTGSGQHAVSVPAMDGALKPNDRLDEAQVIHTAPGVDNLVQTGGSAYFSAGREVFRLGLDAQPLVQRVASLQSEVTSLAAMGKHLAIGLDGGGICFTGGQLEGLVIATIGDRAAKAPVALQFENERTLLVALGSQRHRPSEWQRDLMERGATGSVWRVELPSGRSTLLADGMAYPYGIALTGHGAILVAEAWAHRIVDVSSEAGEIVADDLPFYPARLSGGRRGSIVVCGFAPRRQLVELVLRETRLRKRMLAEVPERYWMAPCLSSGSDCREPLQEGQVRRHGGHRPWAPTRSYGLVAGMDASGRFEWSLHGRAGSHRHGTTSAIVVGSNLLVTAKGGGLLLKSELS